MPIGTAKIINTYLRLSRIFSNKALKHYKAFGEFYGMEECVEVRSCPFSKTRPKALRKRIRSFTCSVQSVAVCLRKLHEYNGDIEGPAQESCQNGCGGDEITPIKALSSSEKL